MTLCIENAEADRMARQLAGFTGASVQQAVLYALREQLKREKRRRGNQKSGLKSELLKIGKRCAALPLLDTRAPDEILGYDKNGLSG